MAISDTYPMLLHPLGAFGGRAAGTSLTIDAAGESVALVGNIVWKGGSGSDTKTISSAGGAIYIPINTVTFANASTTFTVGIQDLSGSVEDGTFDVSATLVGVTDTIAATRYIRVPMETGSKTITFGDVHAIVAEMVTRGGVDVITIDAIATTLLQGTTTITAPYGTQDTGSGPTKRTAPFSFIIEFDDGTLGFVYNMPAMLGLRGSTTVSTSISTTPQRYANAFVPTYSFRVSGMWAEVQGVATTDTFYMFFGDCPISGTPTVYEQVGINPLSTGGTSGIFTVSFPDPITVVPDGRQYFCGLFPDSTNAILVVYQELQTGNAALKAFSDLESMQLISHSGSSWANGSTTQILRCGVIVDGRNIGVGSGSSRAFVG